MHETSKSLRRTSTHPSRTCDVGREGSRVGKRSNAGACVRKRRFEPRAGKMGFILCVSCVAVDDGTWPHAWTSFLCLRRHHDVSSTAPTNAAGTDSLCRRHHVPDGPILASDELSSSSHDRTRCPTSRALCPWARTPPTKLRPCELLRRLHSPRLPRSEPSERVHRRGLDRIDVSIQASRSKPSPVPRELPKHALDLDTRA
mmetsp:Transcript_7000/g.24838  ORF Transcript_7000/g.24838 Transcript_7000/m.24838 type:complete len:201 (-) Transcript_7000:424-1026(-)